MGLLMDIYMNRFEPAEVGKSVILAGLKWEFCIESIGRDQRIWENLWFSRDDKAGAGKLPGQEPARNSDLADFDGCWRNFALNQ